MTGVEQYTDEQIIEAVLNGETGLYEILIRRYNPYLYKTGRAYNYQHTETQDLMQETFIDAYRNLAGFQFRSSFKTWIIRIMLNHCYRKKQKRSFQNEITRDVNEYAKPLFTGMSNDTNNIIQNRELSRIIEQAISAIPLDYRMVFSLREINGLNVAETAKLLEITEANVKVRLNRARTLLRKEIEKTYSTEEIFEFNLVYCDAIVENVMRQIAHEKELR